MCGARRLCESAHRCLPHVGRRACAAPPLALSLEATPSLMHRKRARILRLNAASAIVVPARWHKWIHSCPTLRANRRPPIRRKRRRIQMLRRLPSASSRSRGRRGFAAEGRRGLAAEGSRERRRNDPNTHRALRVNRCVDAAGETIRTREEQNRPHRTRASRQGAPRTRVDVARRRSQTEPMRSQMMLVKPHSTAWSPPAHAHNRSKTAPPETVRKLGATVRKVGEHLRDRGFEQYIAGKSERSESAPRQRRRVREFGRTRDASERHARARPQQSRLVLWRSFQGLGLAGGAVP